MARGLIKLWEALRRSTMISYTARLTIAFVLVAFMTILVVLALLSLSWNQRSADTGDYPASLEDSSETALTQTEDGQTDGQTDGQVEVQTEGQTDEQDSNAAAPVRADDDFWDYSLMAILVAALIAMTFAALFGVFFSRGFIQPLTHITEVSHEVRAGDLSARTNMKGNDELSRLGRALDEMIDAVEKNKNLEHQLTTDVAHELRTPLMAMQATIEAMMDGVLPMDTVRLTTLNSEVIRLGHLVDMQLKLSRLETGRTTLKIEALDLSQLVEDLIISHEMFVEDAELTISHEIEPDVMVRGDANLLRQAVSNLLSNAVRYTPSGGHISIQVRSQRGLAQIFVSDTGEGIAAEDISSVFSRFWRATTSRSRESGGLGIGLTLVREIITRHQGTVHVESERGIGSTFTLNLPLLRPIMLVETDRGSREKTDR